MKRSLMSLKLNKLSDVEFKGCQQEPQDNGSASACADREYDEFTEDWVGFVAY